MRIALAQINPTVGDIDGNIRKIRHYASRAEHLGAELVVFSELCITGYPPRDLLDQRTFIEKTRDAVLALAKQTKKVGLLVGYVERNPSPGQKPLLNAAALLAQGKIQAVRYKMLLPTYDVFDESRHFASAKDTSPVIFRGTRIGVTICEDMWHVPHVWPESPYRKDPVSRLARQKVDFFINLSSSPFHRGKTRDRFELVRHHALVHHRPFVFVNQVGGNDDVLFDGNSFVLDGDGRPIAQARSFDEDLKIVDLKKDGPVLWRDPTEISEIRKALVMGLRDYVLKCGFKQVLLGLSGGIDSAVTAALAVEALGPDHVLGVLMPSEFSSRGSVNDARALANNLGIRTFQIPITPVFSAFKKSLKEAFSGKKEDVTEENLQARIRGTLLMALSNKFGSLLLTTGNKSELSMGYCTLYGDMNGGLAVISDVPKTLVYKVGRMLNENRAVIPEASFTKSPSAELRPNQTDQDALPPYEVLDAIIQAYIEEGKDLPEITQMGYPEELVRRTLNTIDRNEYKRRQAAPGLRISIKAFGIGRRFPIARRGFR